jgi:hypothetical protein
MKSFFFTTSLVIGLTLNSWSQIKLQNGIIALGSETPNAPVSIFGTHTKFNNPGTQVLQLGVMAQDPRIQSTNRIVFYNMTNSDYIDLEVKTLYQSSDINAKENIRALNSQGVSSLEKVKKLNGVTYSWKSDALHQEQVGFIAQEVETVMPDLVITNDTTGRKMMSYTNMIPYLVEAIKEQQVIIDNLQQQVVKLNASLKLNGVKEDELQMANRPVDGNLKNTEQ